MSLLKSELVDVAATVVGLNSSADQLTRSSSIWARELAVALDVVDSVSVAWCPLWAADSSHQWEECTPEWSGNNLLLSSINSLLLSSISSLPLSSINRNLLSSSKISLNPPFLSIPQHLHLLLSNLLLLNLQLLSSPLLLNLQLSSRLLSPDTCNLSAVFSFVFQSMYTDVCNFNEIKSNRDAFLVVVQPLIVFSVNH